MFKLIIYKCKKLDKKIKDIMKKGIEFSLYICLLSALVLFTYETFYNSPDLYYTGIAIFKMGICYIATFIACGFAFNEIKNGTVS